jgi:hypothetical protein
VTDVVPKEPRAAPDAPRSRRAARLVLGAAARLLLASALGLVVNAAAYAAIAGGAVGGCLLSGGRPCGVAVALAAALLVAMPALHAIVAARSAGFRVLTGLALDPALGASERILAPIARTLAGRVGRLRRSADVHLPAGLDEYPFFVRNGMRLALHLSGIARLSGSVEYLKALDAPDPVADLVRLLRRDLATAATPSVVRGSVLALNCGIIAAAWAAVRLLESR